MGAQPPERQSTAPSMLQLGRRVMLVLGLTSLVLVAVWLWLSWHNTKDMQSQRMRLAVTLIASHEGNYFDSVGSQLDRLADDLIYAQALRRPREALALLRRFKAAHPGLAGATIILPNGQIFASTELKSGVVPPNILSNPDWREDFYLNLKARGLSINRTQHSYLVKKWIIPFRYTVRDDSGRVLFLLQSSVLLARQQSLWRNLNFPTAGAAIGLLREDGYLISRYTAKSDQQPDLYRKRNLNGTLYKATLGNAVGGSYEGVAADGRKRYGVYQRLENYPLYAFMSYPESVYMATWWQGVRAPLYLIATVLAASILAYWGIARRFAGRMLLIQGRLTGADPHSPVPSSGVAEIDTLCEALAESREQLKRVARNREKLLLAAAEAGTYAVRVRDGVVVAANRTFLNMLGRNGGEVLGKPWTSLLLDAFGESGDVAAEPEVQGMARRVLRFVGANGEPLWLSVAEYQEDSAGEDLRYGLAIDVSERERLLDTVHVQSQRLRTLWQLATNRAKSEQEKIGLMLRLGLDSLDMDAVLVSEVVGDSIVIRHATDTLGIFPVGHEFPLNDTLCLHSVSAKGSLFSLDLTADSRFRDHRLATQKGIRGYASVPIWVGQHIYGTLVFMRRKPLAEGFGEDDKAFMELLGSWFGQTLLEQRQREVLENMAMTDSLTLLPNRRAAEARFAEEIARTRRTGEFFALAICDLDRFKLINDHYGHDTGDEVLLQVAGVMRRELREGDWVARWGGEEFLVFLHRSDSLEAFAAMERMRLAIRSRPLATRQGALDVAASIGIGVLRNREEDVSRVLSEADGCLYEAKKRGRDCVVVSENAQRGTLWKAGMLQKALQENRVVPAYQTMVDLASNRVVADEALARLVQPDGTIIPAGEFVQAAEGINLIHAVDQTISREAMKRCAALINAGKSGPGLAHFINLSPQFLARKELVRELIDKAREYCNACQEDLGAVKPVVFEITERQLMGDLGELVRDLGPLLNFGFRLALDDFGSGYSSFLYLAELPISFLKIEGWMVRNMRGNEKVRDMVQSIVLVAKRQGITTIAECIEDGATAEILRQMGVDWGQGYFFSYPECDPPAPGEQHS